jgi:hypothetical protein
MDNIQLVETNENVDTHNVQQLRDQASVFDRSIDDDRRRKNGKFYTPSHLVKKAHEYADEALGPDWRQRCVVWDCSSGTANLTRDYAFDELYCSTLDQDEIDVGNLSHSFNNAKEVFKYDFLNGNFEDLPESLRNSIEEGKELTFFVNPPYAASGSSNRAGTTKTEVAKLMKDKGLNAEDLIYQFLFRMKHISRINAKVNICVFSKATWLTGPKTKSFREDFFEYTNFESGFVVNCKEFNGTAGGWPIIFSIFKVDSSAIHKEFNSFEYEIYETGKKYTFFNRSESELPINTLVKLKAPYKDILDNPSTSTGLTVNTTNKSVHHAKEGSLGYILSNSNCRQQSNRECALWSMPYSGKKSFSASIHEENFQRACEVFTARILSKSENYYDDREEYVCPSTSTGLTVNTTNKNTHKAKEGSLGYLLSHSNCRKNSNQLCTLWSMPYSDKHGAPIYKENFQRACEVFTARILSKSENYYDREEEYVCPSTSTGLTVNTTNKNTHKVEEGSLGYLLSSSNNRKETNRKCALWSMPYSAKQGAPIHEENFQRACEVFTARILSKSENYYDEREEYVCPSTSTGLTVNTTNKNTHKVEEGSLGCILSDSNSREKSNRFCALWSMPYSGNCSISIYKENFKRACEVFTARILTKPESYYDEREEYVHPTEGILGSELYAYFGSQALIISIFNAAARQTSVEFDYKGKHWIFKNHFFWLTKSEFYKDVLNKDLVTDDEVPYMIKAMEQQCITQEGMDILNAATELLKISNYDRESFSEQNPVLQLHHWDAGYKQLKQWWNDLEKRDKAFKDKYDAFKSMYSEFEKSVKPLVWDLGFLKKQP